MEDPTFDQLVKDKLRSVLQKMDLDKSHAVVDINEVRRKDRKKRVSFFLLEYTYGPSIDQKTCIWAGDTCSWQDKSSGTMWVAVHGMDSICVVTRTGDLDVTRVRGGLKYNYKETVLRFFRKTVVTEIEDILLDPAESSSSKLLHEKFGQSFGKPFGVVSVIPSPEGFDLERCREAFNVDYVGANKEDEFVKLILELQSKKPKRDGYDETKSVKFLQEKMMSDTAFAIDETIRRTSAEYDEKKAIEFLQVKMQSQSDFTENETIQTAISAFQHLLKKKLKANEIEVTVWEPNYFVTPLEAFHKDIHVKNLEIHDIEGHLAVINDGSCPKSQTSKAKARFRRNSSFPHRKRKLDSEEAKVSAAEDDN